MIGRSLRPKIQLYSRTVAKASVGEKTVFFATVRHLRFDELIFWKIVVSHHRNCDKILALFTNSETSKMMTWCLKSPVSFLKLAVPTKIGTWRQSPANVLLIHVQNIGIVNLVTNPLNSSWKIPWSESKHYY